MSPRYDISREQLAVGPRRIRSIRSDLLKRLSEIIRYTTVCLIQQMKWLAQLKIQERGRAVALKEAAAVQQPEKKPHTHAYTQNPHITSTSGCELAPRMVSRMLDRG